MKEWEIKFQTNDWHDEFKDIYKKKKRNHTWNIDKVQKKTWYDVINAYNIIECDVKRDHIVYIWISLIFCVHQLIMNNVILNKYFVQNNNSWICVYNIIWF